MSTQTSAIEFKQCREEYNGTLLLKIPHDLLGHIGSFIDIFDLYRLIQTSHSIHSVFLSQKNNSTIKSCIRNVFDDEWLQLALSVNGGLLNKAIRWLYTDTLVYRSCHEYKVISFILAQIYNM